MIRTDVLFEKTGWYVLLFGLMIMNVGCNNANDTIVPGQMKEAVFVLPDNTPQGDYVFDFENSKGANYPLCFCLSANNNFPPDCKGNVEYVSHNFKNTPAVPASIGGGCSTEVVKTGMYATVLNIESNYGNSRMKDSVFIGFKVPETVEEGKKISITIKYYKRNNDNGELTPFTFITKNMVIKK